MGIYQSNDQADPGRRITVAMQQEELCEWL